MNTVRILGIKRSQSLWRQSGGGGGSAGFGGVLRECAQSDGQFVFFFPYDLFSCKARASET
jgi:hypothetical protein